MCNSNRQRKHEEIWLTRFDVKLKVFTLGLFTIFLDLVNLGNACQISSGVEQLTRNEQVKGSIPFSG